MQRIYEELLVCRKQTVEETWLKYVLATEDFKQSWKSVFTIFINPITRQISTHPVDVVHLLGISNLLLLP